jgi:hypothetical protein
MAGLQYGLGSFVRRTLAMRLLLACAGIATVFGTATYLARYDIIGKDAVVHGINVVEQLRERVRLIADAPGVTLAAAIQRALDQGSDRRLLSRLLWLTNIPDTMIHRLSRPESFLRRGIRGVHGREAEDP